MSQIWSPSFLQLFGNTSLNLLCGIRSPPHRQLVTSVTSEQLILLPWLSMTERISKHSRFRWADLLLAYHCTAIDMSAIMQGYNHPDNIHGCKCQIVTHMHLGHISLHFMPFAKVIISLCLSSNFVIFVVPWSCMIDPCACITLAINIFHCHCHCHCHRGPPNIIPAKHYPHPLESSRLGESMKDSTLWEHARGLVFAQGGGTMRPYQIVRNMTHQVAHQL